MPERLFHQIPISKARDLFPGLLWLTVVRELDTVQAKGVPGMVRRALALGHRDGISGLPEEVFGPGVEIFELTEGIREELNRIPIEIGFQIRPGPYKLFPKPVVGQASHIDMVYSMGANLHQSRSEQCP
jgi:hypothetical protein